MQMLDRRQSLLQHLNSVANVQDWYSGDRRSHTPLQDDGRLVESSPRLMYVTERNRQMSELTMLVETGAKLSQTIGTVEELSIWRDEWTMTGGERYFEREKEETRGKPCPTSDIVNTGWSHLGDDLQETTTGTSTRWRVMVRTSLRTWKERLVAEHHQDVLMHEYDGNKHTGLVGQESVDRPEVLRTSRTLRGVKSV